MTFETVRFVSEFFLWKLSDGLKTSLNTIHEEVVDMRLSRLLDMSGQVFGNNCKHLLCLVFRCPDWYLGFVAFFKLCSLCPEKIVNMMVEYRNLRG